MHFQPYLTSVEGVLPYKRSMSDCPLCPNVSKVEWDVTYLRSFSS